MWGRKKKEEPEVGDIEDMEEGIPNLGSLLFTINNDASISVSILGGENIGLSQQQMGNLLFHLNNGGAHDLIVSTMLEEAKDNPSGFLAGTMIEWNKLIKEHVSPVVVSPSLALGIGVQFRKLIQQAGL